VKRPILATILIGILVLSGCESTKEDTVASAAGFVPEAETQGAEELKKEPEILPSEQPKEEKKEPSQGQERQTKEEEQQPAEQEQKQPEEQQPVRQEQKQPEEEQPAEEELKLNFVKFWENVEEMSLEEAIEILRQKSKRPLDRMTDEERMASYVVAKDSHFHEEGDAIVLEKSLKEYPGAQIVFSMKFEDDFTQKIFEDEDFLKLIAWDEQSLAKGITNYRPPYEGENLIYPVPYKLSSFYITLYRGYGEEMRLLEAIEFAVDGEKSIECKFSPYQNGQRCRYTDENTKQLFLNCVRFYLSIETIQIFDSDVRGLAHLD